MAASVVGIAAIRVRGLQIPTNFHHITKIVTDTMSLTPAIMDSLQCLSIENDVVLERYRTAWWDDLDHFRVYTSHLEIIADAFQAFEQDRVQMQPKQEPREHTFSASVPRNIGPGLVEARKILFNSQGRIRDRMADIMARIEELRQVLEDSGGEDPLEPPGNVIARARRKILRLEMDQYKQTMSTLT